MTTRTLTPELLDSLPHDDPEARRSRRDLRWINRAMGNHRWFARTLPPLLRAGERALELGAGDGILAARLEARGVAVDGLDFCQQPAEWPRTRTWHAGDLRSFGGFREYAASFGNLILHHLDDAQLAGLGAKLRSSARVILASEPKRSAHAQRLVACFGRLLGASRVTLHDAHVSIAAGFLGRELPQVLGLLDGAWEVQTATTSFGAYRMVAIRRP